ncbi:MAG TPA: nitroreductase family protein [Candidatus Polarisedimenticolaceae bacterium]|nr:nitroreductase family protein [Candidatus Polarisedimenticolaceae bacterium]
MSDTGDHPFTELIRGRTTVERFDARRGLDETEVRALVRDAVQAPSSFNIQHWRFVAVRRPDDKRRLMEAAYGQQQVADAAVTFIVLGDTRGADKLPLIVERAVGQGALADGKAAAWVRLAERIYADPTVARDEAIRSASLAAMVLMLAAEARGLGSGALSGFDAGRVRREFAIDQRYVPVMLLCVGHPASVSGERQPRLSVDEVLSFDRGRVF